MSESLIGIEGKLSGEEKVIEMINRSPEQYRRAIFAWLGRERKSFVGNGKSDGAFRKKLLKKKSVKGGTWDTKVVRLFKGRIDNSKTIGMKLHMGLLYQNQRKIHQILESLSESHTISSSGYMIIPVAKNLYGSFKPMGLFRIKMDRKELGVVRSGSELLFFDRVNKKELLFVGTKTAKIRQQFHFERDWEKRLPAVLERYKKAIDKATEKVSKRA